MGYILTPLLDEDKQRVERSGLWCFSELSTGVSEGALDNMTFDDKDARNRVEFKAYLRIKVGI